MLLTFKLSFELHICTVTGFFFGRKSSQLHSTEMPKNRVFGLSNRVFGLSNRVFGLLNRVFDFQIEF